MDYEKSSFIAMLRHYFISKVNLLIFDVHG